MTSSIKLWKPQVTDWNLINSEHHFRLEKTNLEPRWTAATLSRYVFAVMTSHEILSSTLETPSDPRYGDEKSCLFIFILIEFVYFWCYQCTDLSERGTWRLNAVKIYHQKKYRLTYPKFWFFYYVTMTSSWLGWCTGFEIYLWHPNHDFYFKMNLNLITRDGSARIDFG